MKRKYIYMIVTFALMIGLFGISFGYLKDVKESSGNSRINLSSFGIQFQSGKEVTSVSMSGLVPVLDVEGLNNQSTTFGIENVGAIKAGYKVSLVDGTTPSTMLNKDARYQLKKGINGATPTVVGIYNLSDDGVIDEGVMSPGDTIDYELIMWVDYDANPNGQSFSKHVMIEGMQLPSLDSSGANFPELADNMISVYYDTSGNVWKKADPTNGLDTTTNLPVTTPNYQYQWFDYDNQMWANAVTVKENGTNTRDYYLNAELGTTIPMEDITTMWVWIPRFKYVIFNSNNETVEEKMINVIFEHGRDTTGSINGVNNPTIVNNKSTYTHPAFTFGSDELTGFWMAKFEMSTDDNSCNTTANETNCNKTGLNILIKPDVLSLRYENVSNMFANIRRMESYGNIHGFKQNENATTFLNASNQLTGEINSDSNTIDTHMIKNMEWGAVAYLSQSKYGKQGNSNYSGNYSEIYVNNNSNYKTGYSGGSYDSNESNSNTYLYNNLTTNGEGQGYKGAGASTTGNVYGVFDMSGGTHEFVAGVLVDSQNNPIIGSAGTWNSSNFMNAKYYDQYTSTSFSTASKLGDAIKEVKVDSATFWYMDICADLANNSYPWYVRGAGYNQQERSGIYSVTNSNGAYNNFITSRPVLTVSRNMPWLNNNS